MKLLIYTQLWKRPELTEICIQSWKKLKGDITIFAVISEEEMIPICEKYGVKWAMTENLPLGKKHNHGLKEALKLDWDYCMNVGSDDIVSQKLLDLYRPNFKAGDHFFGLRDMYFYSKGNLIYFYYKEKYSAFGAGRVVSRKLIETVGDFYEPELNKGLDRSSEKIAARFGFECKTLTMSEPFLVDVKTDVNIWDFKHYQDKSIKKDAEVLKKYFTQELDSLKTLKTYKMTPVVKTYQHIRYASIRLKMKDEKGELHVLHFTNGVSMRNGVGESVPGMFVTADTSIQKMIESSARFDKDIILLVDPTTIKTEEVVVAGGWNHDFAEYVNANAASSAIAKKFELQPTSLRGKENLKKYVDENKIALPLIFEDHKTV
jgi:hypothetical protein